MNLHQIAQDIQKKIDDFTDNSYRLSSTASSGNLEQITNFILKELEPFPPEVKNRIFCEFFGLGPLEILMEDQDICEILVNGKESIWFEKNGQLSPNTDSFLSAITYRNIMDRICHLAKIYPTAERPIADGHFGQFRLNLVRSEIHPDGELLSLRRHPENSWTLESLCQSGWCSQSELNLIKSWVDLEKNFLIVGPTSSGKTSVLNACLNATKSNHRMVILEDSSEIKVPNSSSIKLLTRRDSQGLLPDITLENLLKTSLRLRPDRIIVGEMRGGEAKDFLMALSSGHKGGISSLHAESASQALLRLEMLIQLGAPQWGLSAIRKLIQLSLHGVLVTTRDQKGRRKFAGLYSISSLEDIGFTLERSGIETLSAISSDNGAAPSLTSF